MEIGITIVSEEQVPVIQPFLSAATAGGGDRAKYYFTTGVTFTQWQLYNIILQAEVVALDINILMYNQAMTTDGASFPYGHNFIKINETGNTTITETINSAIAGSGGISHTFRQCHSATNCEGQSARYTNTN